MAETEMSTGDLNARNPIYNNAYKAMMLAGVDVKISDTKAIQNWLAGAMNLDEYSDFEEVA